MRILSNLIISEDKGNYTFLLTTEDDVVTLVECADSNSCLDLRSAILNHYAMLRSGLVCNEYKNISAVLEHIRDELGLNYMFTCFSLEDVKPRDKEEVVYKASLLNGVYNIEAIRMGEDSYKVRFGRQCEYPLEMFVDAQVFEKLKEYVSWGAPVEDIRKLITYG